MLFYAILLPLIHCALVRYDSPAWMQSPSCGIPCISSTIVDVLHCTESDQTCVCPELDVDRGLAGCIAARCTEEEGDKAFDAVGSWCEGHTTASIFRPVQRATGFRSYSVSAFPDLTSTDYTTTTSTTDNFLSTESSAVATTTTQTTRSTGALQTSSTAQTSSTRLTSTKTPILTLISTVTSASSSRITTISSKSIVMSSISTSSTLLNGQTNNSNSSNGYHSSSNSSSTTQTGPAKSDPNSEEITGQPKLTGNGALTLAIGIPLGIITSLAAFTYFRYFRSLRKPRQSQFQPNPDNPDSDLNSDPSTIARRSVELVFYELSAEKDPVELEANEKPRISEIEGIKRVVRESGLKLAIMFGMKGGAKERDEQKGDVAMRMRERKTWG
ncbi:hypothetical protein F5Y18DRAFT_423168 [Xylariaceae sp. FL1019]|nr:hypothetical protein F5Y18DRAFT_423168 [Xylariaceae sp. FL1019]